MKHHPVLLLVFSLAMPVAVSAQGAPCPGPRALNGACANAPLLRQIETQTWLHGQVRLNESQLPILPREEWLPGSPAGGLTGIGMPSRVWTPPPALVP